MRSSSISYSAVFALNSSPFFLVSNMEPLSSGKVRYFENSGTIWVKYPVQSVTTLHCSIRYVILKH